MARTVLVFGGGDPLTSQQIAALPTADLVIGADSGVDRAREAGRAVDLAVGDFDSVTAAGLAAAVAEGARLVRHPEVKNETDLELALLEALMAGAARVVVAGIDGGRADHHLANLALLADTRFSAAHIEALLGDGRVSVVQGEVVLGGAVGDLVSLVPMGGDADGVATRGLRYPLRSETLPAGSPRGMSNVFTDSVAQVSLTAGTLLAFQPGSLE